MKPIERNELERANVLGGSYLELAEIDLVELTHNLDQAKQYLSSEAFHLANDAITHISVALGFVQAARIKHKEDQ